MATPCVIKIEGINFAKIYKHWDGDSDDLFIWLQDFNKKFEAIRKSDPEYKFAQLLRNAYADALNSPNSPLDGSLDTGWGVVSFNDQTGAYVEYLLTGTEVIKKIL
jgi:hypothetical protein